MMSTDTASGRFVVKFATTAFLLPIVWMALTTRAESAPSPQAKPPTSGQRTVESDDPRLREALAAVRASRTCASLTAVGTRYHDFALGDAAERYLAEAIGVDPECAEAHDSLAKVWRQAGRLDLALGSAHRATYFSPHSPSFWNTYGTILQEIGKATEAAAAYRRVVALDASAAYAHSNLCYLSMQLGDDDGAARACLAALAVDPTFTPALNNLGLLRAAAGRWDEAFELFVSAGGVSAAHYNVGMVRLSLREYSAALTAFEAAYACNPAFDDAYAKARIVRRLLNPRSEKPSVNQPRR